MSKKPFPSEEAEKIVVRLPDGMRDRLKVLARANHRSVNAEVVFRLGVVIDAAARSPAAEVRP